MFELIGRKKDNQIVITKQLCDDAIRLLEWGESFIQATILKSSGSVPRGTGACMLILRDGSIRGTVGGGALEAGIIKASASVMGNSTSRKIDMVLDGNDLVATGMICGGSATVLIEYIDVTPENLEIFKQWREQASVNNGTVYIFGAGHCGEKLAHVLYTVGFNTVVIDDRAEFANAERFPEADEILVPKSMDIPFGNIAFNTESYIVIVTRGHAQDELVLRGALRTEVGYIGMIGSKKKRDSIYARLLADGYMQSDIDRVTSPIGIPIEADTPEEIAVSIAAELIKLRAKWKANDLS